MKKEKRKEESGWIVIFLGEGRGNCYRVRTGPGKPGKSWNFVF